MNNIVKNFHKCFSQADSFRGWRALRTTTGCKPLQTPSDEHLAALKRILPKPGAILTEELDKYNSDWIGKYKGNSQLVLLPSTTLEVSKILKYCNENKVPIVPQGGNTGLVGGSVPIDKEIVLSTSNLTQVRALDVESRIFSVESGMILQNANDYLENHQLMMPLDLGSKGSCTVGGNVSTNAGGIRYLRYGSLHGSVVGLEVVLANGDVLDLMRPVRKDNTGYDLKHLFIGSEGTLGIVTAVAIQVASKPVATNAVVLGLESFEAVQEALALARQRHCGEILSAAEFWDRPAMELLLEVVGKGVRDPLSCECPFYLLLETQGSNDAHDKEKLWGLLEALQETGLIQDGAVAQDSGQVADFWKLREWLPVAVKDRGGIAFKYDVSVPTRRMVEVTELVRKHLTETGIADKYRTEVVQWGHLGDGNLHVNVRCDEFHKEIEDALEPMIYEIVSERNGSISAEHGIGQMKVDSLHFSKSSIAIETMKQVKQTLDPQGILNPNKVLPLNSPA